MVFQQALSLQVHAGPVDWISYFCISSPVLLKVQGAMQFSPLYSTAYQSERLQISKSRNRMSVKTGFRSQEEYLKMLLRGPIKHPPVSLVKFAWNSVKSGLELRDLSTQNVRTTETPHQHPYKSILPSIFVDIISIGLSPQNSSCYWPPGPS